MRKMPDWIIWIGAVGFALSALFGFLRDNRQDKANGVQTQIIRPEKPSDSE